MSAEPSGSDGAGQTPIFTADGAGEPAGGRRRLVEIRCGFAEMARQEAEAAAARVEQTRRLLDGQADALARAQAAIDPAATHAAKDGAHRSFRATVAAARTRGQVEAAANTWLNEINKINAAGRTAQARVRHERESVDELLSQLAKQSDFAEASSATAAAAMEACRAARAELEASGAVEEGEAPEATVAAASAALESLGEPEPVTTPGDSRSAAPAEAPTPVAPVAPAAQVVPLVGENLPSAGGLVVDIRARHPQAIIRLLRRDNRTMNVLVRQLGGGDSAARRGWKLLLSNFVDSVVAAAIDDACFEFPAGHPFWSQFSVDESREVARGLATLGFRYDGLGGFADEHVPTQRDLTLAVGQAGLIPVRVHYWPRPDEEAQLFEGVRVSGDYFIALRAPTLTLGDLVRILGRRAELLTDLWNAWPRVRPLLLATRR